jgi:hypothetical protein
VVVEVDRALHVLDVHERNQSRHPLLRWLAHDREMVIEDLSEEEGEAFLAAVQS